MRTQGWRIVLFGGLSLSLLFLSSILWGEYLNPFQRIKDFVKFTRNPIAGVKEIVKDKNPLVGTWQLVDVYNKPNNINCGNDYLKNWRFFEDGTVYANIKYPATYKILDENNLKITSQINGFQEFILRYKVSGERLYLTITDNTFECQYVYNKY